MLTKSSQFGLNIGILFSHLLNLTNAPLHFILLLVKLRIQVLKGFLELLQGILFSLQLAP